MDKEYERQYTALEEENWWFAARRELVRSLLSRYGKGKMLEIGCGSGKNIRFLGKYGYAISGIDNSEYMVKCAKKAGANVKQCDAVDIKFKDESFDTVLCLDMLEHIEDDKKAAKEIYRVLKKGGRAIITVPAFSFLWGQQDIVNQHKRRYTKRQLKELLAGFKIKKISYWNFLLFFAVTPVRLLRRKKKNAETDFKNYPKFINNILLGILKIDNFLFNAANLPFGVSLVAVVEK